MELGCQWTLACIGVEKLDSSNIVKFWGRVGDRKHRENVRIVFQFCDVEWVSDAIAWCEFSDADHSTAWKGPNTGLPRMASSLSTECFLVLMVLSVWGG
jgi:hypothetical protein